MSPPKSRKSVCAWNFCGACNATVSQKDLEIHVEQSCPPSSTSWIHGYIKDKVLYGLQEEVKPKDGMKNVPKSECDDLVLISQSALQLCDISIGDPVIVEIQGMSTVMIAWPTSEKSLVSVLMTKQAKELHWSSNCSSHVKVKKLNVQPLPTDSITVHLVDRLCCSIFDIPTLLHRKYRRRILKTGNKLYLQHYGQHLHFTVERLSPFKEPSHLDERTSETLERLSEDLSGLTLTQNASCGDVANLLFIIVEGTKWNLELSQDFDEKGRTKDKNISTVSSIGGSKKVMAEVRELIKLALRGTPLIKGLPVVRGILLYGVSGTGKTLLAKALAAESKASVVTVCAAEIYSKFLGETESRLRHLFKTAEDQAPSIILLDEVDALCPKRNTDGSGGSEQDKRVVSTLLTLLDGLHSSTLTTQGKEKSSVLVIATTSKPDAIDPALRRPGRLDREIEITVPTPDDRLDILCKILASSTHDITKEEMKNVAYSAHGFVGADLASLCSQGALHAVKRTSLNDNVDITITMEDLAFALTRVKPSAMREVLIEVPNVRWSDIGGQDELKLKLRQAVEWPLKHPEVFDRLGISPPKGILMYGPPGCSKTMIAKALATESKLNFLSIKGPELFSKWVGESERAVREVFRRARQVAPAIVFFDELDALGGERSGSSGSGSSNVQERVLAQLLTELDGVEPLGNVTVVGATNRPDRIDKALLRPGRLDRVIYVPLPDANTRQEIFVMQLCKMPVDSNVNIDNLVGRTEGYSGAEVLAVCHEAALKALEEDLNCTKVSWNHFISALQLITPRTPPSLLKLYETYLRQN